MASSRSLIAELSTPERTGRTIAELKVAATPRPRPFRKARTTGPPVLPGENARAYRGRLAKWTGTLGPRNDVESYLVERAVALSWQLDRVDRVQLAQLTRIATRLDPDQASRDAIGGPTILAFDDSVVGGRLRDYQLACGQALFRTLDAFATLRGIGEGAAASAAASPTPTIVSDPAPAVIVARPVAVAPRSATEPSVRIRPDEMNGTTDESDGAGGSPRPARRRPAVRRLRGGPSWTGSGGPESTGSAACSARSRPIRRSDRQPDATPNPPDARRRVGGYNVPLDPALTVSCADRIPVRLRRDAAATRRAQAAAFPAC
jgi:hypothetical protein